MNTPSVRLHGGPPYSVVVLHGGPGALGEMAPVAQELSKQQGVLETLQKETSVDRQVEELRLALKEYGQLPATLIGHSWGAMLAFLFAARYPEQVKQLILVSSGPFESRLATTILPTRLSRLSEQQQHELKLLIDQLDDPAVLQKDSLLGQLGAVLSKADAYDALQPDTEPPTPLFTVYQQVWREATALRETGHLIAMGRNIACPVIAIHGAYDPHPCEGVREPLSAILRDFRFILLERCGHTPWLERQARDHFFEFLRKEVSSR